ncbi:hypothetical protein AVEN_245025-1 [Araneus ventricosus]|uniref:Uncharacterized protein n=1 Tax=Araneus ventricosus TaxID=182803 RepID=A0A4Y2EAD7_ARAVE|nr:hypothetical protein AVEN_245025-1 [Araneus ventricosus]
MEDLAGCFQHYVIFYFLAASHFEPEAKTYAFFRVGSGSLLFIFKPTSSKAMDRSKWRCRRCLLLLVTEISGLDTLRYFLWGYVKDRVYVPPMPKTIEELKVRICNALASVTEQMLQNAWREMDYRLDVVRVTKGCHIEHL